MSLNIPVLEQSFDQIKPHANEFVASFYTTLFADYPQLRPMFAQTNLAEQHKKLIGALVLVIANLRRPEVLANALRGLGARHALYGVRPEHFDMVGAALLKTFELYLGEAWTPTTEQAWTNAYGAIVGLMLEGAETQPARIAA